MFPLHRIVRIQQVSPVGAAPDIIRFLDDLRIRWDPLIPFYESTD
jgi:hypothetical protein